MYEKKSSSPYCNCSGRCLTKLCMCKRKKKNCSSMCHPSKTCSNVTISEKNKEIIDLTEMPEPSTQKPWKVIGTTHFYSEDEMILKSGWLNDKIIHASQQLLKQQYPDVLGWQDPILQKTAMFEVLRGKDFVQILNHGGNHWVTVSTVGCRKNTIKVYDSLNLTLTKELKLTVADLLYSEEDHITIKYVKMQYQIGTNDCGLFAVASACAICNGIDLAEIKFEQKCMRSHLINCLSNGLLDPFPAKNSRKKIIYEFEKNIQVYCICRRPYSGTKMIECCSCKQWYHTDCLKLQDTDIAELQWLCYNCT